MHVNPGSEPPTHWLAKSRGTARPATVNQESVKDSGERLDRVDIGRHASRRLRLTVRDHPRDHVGTAAERIDADRIANRLGGLGEDVPAVTIAGVHQRTVPHRVPPLQREPRQRGRTVDANVLGAHADPDEAVAQQLRAEVAVVGRKIDQGRHVEPLDHDDTVELRGVGWPPDEQAALVRRRGHRGAWPRGPEPVESHAGAVGSRSNAVAVPSK